MKKILSVSLVSVVACLSAATSALAETKVPFALDWKFEGPSAAYFAAIDNGHFGAAGLDVDISAGSGIAGCHSEGRHRRFPDRLSRSALPTSIHSSNSKTRTPKRP